MKHKGSGGGSASSVYPLNHHRQHCRFLILNITLWYGICNGILILYLHSSIWIIYLIISARYYKIPSSLRNLRRESGLIRVKIQRHHICIMTQRIGPINWALAEGITYLLVFMVNYSQSLIVNKNTSLNLQRIYYRSEGYLY
jgi:hypothetical protein